MQIEKNRHGIEVKEGQEEREVKLNEREKGDKRENESVSEMPFKYKIYPRKSQNIK